MAAKLIQSGVGRVFTLVAVCGALLLASGFFSVAQASSSSSPGVVTLVGNLPRTTATASTIVVEAQIGSDYKAHHIPQKLEDVPIGSAQAAAGSSAFSINIRPSAALSKAERQGRGVVNAIVAVYSGHRYTQLYVPVPLSAAASPANTLVTAEVRDRTVRVGRLPAFSPLKASMALGGPNVVKPPPCIWEDYGSEYEAVTKIGQIHVADIYGMTETFEYGTNADTTISIGVSADSGSGYSDDGTVTISNSIGTDAGFTAGNGTRQHADTQMYYQRYSNEFGGCSTNYLMEDVGATGSAFLGTGSVPGADPYGTCTDDPYGYATIAANNGTYSADRAHAETESTAATLFGFNFSASSGYSSTLFDHYKNTTPNNQTLCGTNYMPGVKTIFNNTW